MKNPNSQNFLSLILFYICLAAGVVWSDLSAAMAAFIKYGMMGILFLSFIKISPADVIAPFRTRPMMLSFFIIFRLVTFPLIAYYIAWLYFPQFAVAILLLSACSTAVAAPFFATLTGGNIGFNLVMAVMTNILMPISLPPLVKFLVGNEVSLSSLEMIYILGIIVFTPLGAAFLGRAVAPRLIAGLDKISKPVSISTICLINFSALGKYTDYLMANAMEVGVSLILCCGLALAAGLAGWLFTLGRARDLKLSAAGTMIWFNNAVILALAVEIDQPLTVTMSAVYFLPLFAAIPILGLLGNARKRGPQIIAQSYPVPLERLLKVPVEANRSASGFNPPFNPDLSVRINGQPSKY